MAGSAASTPDERRPVIDELADHPHPAVSRAALAARHPAWGLATVSLLAVGLVAGFMSLGPLGATIKGCTAVAERLVCSARMHAIVVVLPMASLIAGLAVALVGGRVAIRLGRSPLLAAAAGWVVFLAGMVTAYAMGGVI
ncbi:hypothetical protein [Pseudonocardia acaciae]|uniref:hypothetical protein n=1 Tax=Pseudonocardia acaciae TaxID=551276 RepID=UPI0012EE57D0|nr:hypothetical protein [Pseudonocardia acaciae]